MGLLPVAQAGMGSVWSPDGGQYTVLQDVGYGSTVGSSGGRAITRYADGCGPL